MKHLPNALTLANLFCGCCALLNILYWQFDTAAWCIAGSFLFDYADGMAARALGVSSPLGKELDSLADVVSFGVVPGALLYQLINGGTTAEELLSGISGLGQSVQIKALPAFVLTAFSALRLAKFNLDTRQANYFIGLSTPACTVFVLGLALAAQHDRFGWAATLGNKNLLYGIIALLSWLLVSEIPMFGMKVKKGMGNNLLLLGFLLLFGGLFVFLKELAFSAIIICYIAASVLMKDKVAESAA